MGTAAWRVRARIWLSSRMWAPVLGANLLALGLGLMMPRFDEDVADSGLLRLALSSAEQIFGAIAAGMITFTGIVFSAVLVATQLQTSSYSPRLAARLRRDRVVIAALALPTATATYALFALASLGDQAHRTSSDSAPELTVVLALLLTFATFAVFVALVQRAFDSTQIGGILRGLLRRGLEVIDEAHPVSEGTARGVDARLGDVPVHEVVHEGAAGVLASVDRSALLGLAAESGAFVEVVPRVGQYVSDGHIVMRLHGTSTPTDPGTARRVLILARQRTMDQDPAFALRILVDIAIRGLSPAVNDPTTAVQALDRIETMLFELHRRSPGPAVVADTDGEPRGVVPGPGWEEYVDLALVEIRQYGASSAQVARRLRALHDRLLTIVAEEQRPRVERERRLLAEAVQARFPDPRERDLLSRPDPLGIGGAP